MEVHPRTAGDVVVLTLRGQCEQADLPAVRAQVDALVEGGARRLCLNFGGVSFLDSSTIGYLVELGKRLEALDGELVLSEPSKFFAATIRTLELHHLFEIFPHDDAALDHLAGS
jgi:anti-sigma B factor antagonist